MKLHEFPRHSLTFGPSPLQHLDRLSRHLGGAQIWAKREDVNSGLAFGGNKVRKLEYIVPDILASGADTIVSIGGYQSQHPPHVAAAAAHLGLEARRGAGEGGARGGPHTEQGGPHTLHGMSGGDSRSTLMATKSRFTAWATWSSAKDSWAMTWHQWHAASPTESRTGTSRRRASAKASCVHSCQSTGLSWCCRR